jgi:arylsulfatase A-like enzyme
MGKDGGSAGALRGAKASTWEGGVRVPTIAWWPGRVPAGSTCDAFAGTIDLLPTFVRLADGEVAAVPAIDGRDISGLLLGTSHEPVREAHYYFKGQELQAVRDGRWKLAIVPQPNGTAAGSAAVEASLAQPRLYDLEADIGETTDVSTEHPGIVARLRGLAERMAAELCGPRAPGRRPAGTVEKPVFLYSVVDEPAAAAPPKQLRKKPAD